MVERTGSFVHLPAELEYLIEPAMKYGVHQFNADIDHFLDTASEEDMQELDRLGERVRRSGDMEAIELFHDDYPINESEESGNLYFLFYVMDAAGIEFTDDAPDTVESLIAALQKFGSYRLASGRAHAARALAEFGGRAKSAIPQLEQAVADDDHRVRVWAHFALALITGNRKQHLSAIRAIFAQHQQCDEFGDYDDVGMEAWEALEMLAPVASFFQKLTAVLTGRGWRL